jgi:molecular chaperone HscB
VVVAKVSVSELSAAATQVSPASMQNYFELLGLPTGPEPDPVLLERNYRILQAALHPDRFISAPAADRLAALQRAGLLNEAHSTLKSPLGCAAHLLALHGIDPAGHSQQELAPAFLLEQMELREELESLVHTGDFAGLESLQDQVRQLAAAVWQRFVARVQSGDIVSTRPLYHELQFLHKLLDEAAAAEDRMLD